MINTISVTRHKHWPLHPSSFKLHVVLAFSSLVGHAQTTISSSSPKDLSVSTSLHPPAVAELNGKVSYVGGGMNSFEGHNFDGSVTVPIANQFGFQADALFSHVSKDDFYGGGGHLFWRNPDIGLLGLSGGYLTHQDVDAFQVGIEGEYYWNRFTFGIFAGVGSISYVSSAPFIDMEPTKFVGRASADWYALDDLRLGISYTTAFDNHLVKGEAEYQTPIRGLAITAEVAAGDHGYDHWLFGIRYYFGSKKTLRERHRQDDPRSLMPQILHELGLYGAEFNRQGQIYSAAHPEVGSGGGASYGIIFERGGYADPIRGGTMPPIPPDGPINPDP